MRAEARPSRLPTPSLPVSRRLTVHPTHPQLRLVRQAVALLRAGATEEAQQAVVRNLYWYKRVLGIS